MSDQERWEKEKEEQQSILKHDFAKEMAGREVTDEEAETIVCTELMNDYMDEYLVDGAVLSCTSAVWDDFPLSGNESVHIEGVEKKTKEDKPTGILRVWENPMYINNLHHANVTDTKQGLNIMPFPCNCKEAALSEKKEEIRKNKADCQKNGVCKYLMDLEEEWENIDFNEQEYMALEDSSFYREFVDVNATESIGVVNVGSLGIGNLKNGRKQGITMTSVLFCKHGGFIYPVTSGQKSNLTEIQAHIKNVLETLGWTVGLIELRKIDEILLEFNITDKNSITCFLLICVSESGAAQVYANRKDKNGKTITDEFGRAVTEFYPKDYNPGYPYEVRGVAYMQITHRDSQLECLKYLKENGYYDGYIDENALGYVEELRKLPWEASAWRWAVCVQTEEKNLNNYVKVKANDNGNQLTMGIFLTAESFINGKVKGGASDPLGKIARGELEWEYDMGKNVIKTDEKSFSAPNNWNQFEDNYELLMEGGFVCGKESSD